MASTMTAALPDDPPPPVVRHRSLRAVVLLTHHADTPPDAMGALASFQSGIIPEDVLVVVLMQHGGSSTCDPRHAMMVWAVDHGQTIDDDSSATASAPLVDWRDLYDAWGALVQSAIQLVHKLHAALDPAVTLVLIEPPPALHDHLPVVRACRRVDTHPSAHSANLLAYLTLTLSPLDRRALQQLFIDVMPVLDAVSDTQPLMSRNADVQLLGKAADPTTRARLQLLLTHLVHEHVLVPYTTAFGELPRVHAQRGILYLVDHDQYQAIGQALARGEMLPSLTKPGESIPLPFRPIRPHCATCSCLHVPPPSPPAGTRTTYAQLLYQLVADPDPPPDLECREDPDSGEFTYRVHVRGLIVYGTARRDRDAARESAAKAALVQLGVIDADADEALLPSAVHVLRPGPFDGATCGTKTQLRPPPITIDGPGTVASHSTAGGLSGSYGWSSGGR
ncbi:hypothetical protein AMAG_18258 [Allomyces macrogynus ATCC 38327]|uniref:Uncharacterized protein n=1 Tax=Allomyces macrogynus (strain ATCC 38327) TaxID=578462 RepID=A0A0L0S7U6_ALLM3|nr:hypothetical protein AMAG_18258 [Allomyces macrogynus ATCC 38327]|eukprot:KNE58491.1 hypothetical protein AMAG_18258 [Allomyces macrogynus ATCC 38327]